MAAWAPGQLRWETLVKKGPIFKTSQDLKEQSENAYRCMPVPLSLSRLCCYLQSAGFVGHGGDSDLKEVMLWGLRTIPCAPLPLLAIPAAPSNCCFPTFPHQALLPIDCLVAGV